MDDAPPVSVATAPSSGKRKRARSLEQHEPMAWTRLIPRGITPCSMYVQVRSEFSGEYAARAVANEYNNRVGKLSAIKLDLLSSADWDKQCQRVAANNFPNHCRFKDSRSCMRLCCYGSCWEVATQLSS